MATIAAKMEIKLAWYARWLLKLATFLNKWLLIKVPHRWVVAVTNRSWLMRVGSMPWRRITIDSFGRVTACARG